MLTIYNKKQDIIIINIHNNIAFSSFLHPLIVDLSTLLQRNKTTKKLLIFVALFHQIDSFEQITEQIIVKSCQN